MKQVFQRQVGQVAAGNINNFYGRNPLPFSSMTHEELCEQLDKYESGTRSGYRGFFLNVPFMLMSAIGIGLVLSIFSGTLPAPVLFGGFPILPIVVLGMTLPLMYWLNNVLRVEMRYIQECQEVIDDIKAELRRRRG